VFYAVNLLVLTLLLFLQLRHLAASLRLIAPDLTPEAIAHLHRQLLLFGVVPVVSIAASFCSPRLGMYLYALLAVAALPPGRVDRLTRVETDGNEPAP
jgi:TRAP-type mannitol/chloroaromatic compound transport system permease large subunit